MYHPRMKIHNVHSGEWIGQGMKPDFSKYIKIGLRLKGAVNGSTNGVKHREASEDE